MAIRPSTDRTGAGARGRLAVRAEVDGIDDLDRAATADRLRSVTGRIHSLEAERLALAAHWADLHAPDVDVAELEGLKDAVTGERFLPTRSPDTPLVSEFAAPTLGALIGVGSYAADSMIDDALDLRHRHPRLHRLVMAGRVPAWQARRVVSVTADAGVSSDDAHVVDAATAADFARLPFPRAMKLLEAALLAAPSSTRAAQQQEAQQKQYARAGRSNDAGMKSFIAQTTAAGIIRYEATITLVADRLLALGDTRPVDQRRAAAFLLLASPAHACLLLAGHAPAPDAEECVEAADPEPAETFSPSDGSRLDDAPAESDEPGEPGAHGTWDFREDRAWPFTFGRQLDLFAPAGPAEPDGSSASDTAFVVAAARAVGDALRDLGTGLGPRLWDRLRPRSVLYLHGWHHSGDGGDPVGPVVRADGVGEPLLADTVKAWLAHDRVQVRPVIDATTHLAADAYEAPAPIREQVRLRHPFEEFPHGRQASHTCDLDHLRTYRTDGPPGQTSTANLEPLGRRHHRSKTHGRWKVQAVDRADRDRVGALWRAPTGHWFLVDHLGTHDLDRPTVGPETHFADIIWSHTRLTA